MWLDVVLLAVVVVLGIVYLNGKVTDVAASHQPRGKEAR